MLRAKREIQLLVFASDHSVQFLCRIPPHTTVLNGSPIPTSDLLGHRNKPSRYLAKLGRMKIWLSKAWSAINRIRRRFPIRVITCQSP